MPFDCEEVAATVAGLERRGVEVPVRPREIGGWNEALVMDPNGIWIEFVPRKVERAPGGHGSGVPGEWTGRDYLTCGAKESKKRIRASLKVW